MLLPKNSSLAYPPCFSYTFWKISPFLNTWLNIYLFRAVSISLNDSALCEGIPVLLSWWKLTIFLAVHSFIQQICIEHLPLARHFSRH